MTEKQKVFDYLKHGFTQDQVLLRVRPQHKKSVEMVYELYDKPANQPDHRFVTVTEVYRWGEGYAEGDRLDRAQDFVNNNLLDFDITVGHGPELDDLIAIYYDYSGDHEWTEEEKRQFQGRWENGEPDDEDGRSGASWLYDVQDEWQVEIETLYIHGPYRLDIVDKDEYNKVYIEDYKPTEEDNNG